MPYVPGIFDIVIPGTPAHDAWEDNAGQAIDQVHNPSTAGEVIDFGKYRDRTKPKDNDKPKSCPPDDDGYCKWRQDTLLRRQLLIFGLQQQGLMDMYNYRQSALSFDAEVEEHNRSCPNCPVAPLHIGPFPVD